MHKRMTATARAELADAIRPRYAAVAAKEKRKILVTCYGNFGPLAT